MSDYELELNKIRQWLMERDAAYDADTKKEWQITRWKEIAKPDIKTSLITLNTAAKFAP
nr:MAG TPA: hypothetical protein [Caudoviricetes sp.]